MITQGHRTIRTNLRLIGTGGASSLKAIETFIITRTPDGVVSVVHGGFEIICN